jgi:hypothetical protein
VDGALPYLVGLIVVALAFDFLNGLHDAANSIATIVSTRVLPPQYAVFWAAFFNFVAFLFFGLHVAQTVGTGIVTPDVIDDRGIDDPGADGLGDVQAEHAEGDEVEESGPEHRILRPEHAGRDDGRDRVGGVMQAVQEVERERDGDEADQDGKAELSVHGAALP